MAVPDEISRFHALVRKTRDSLRSATEDPRGLRHAGQGCLAVSVTRQQVPRALRIMHVLAVELERRDAVLEVPKDRRDPWQPKDLWHIAATIHGEPIEFGIVERVKQTRNPDTSPKKIFEYRPAFLFTPSGQLSLRSRAITDQHRWADSDKYRVEDLLNEFVLALFETAIRHRDSRARRAEQERLDAVAAFQRYEETQRIRELETECAAWVRSRQMRAYLRAVERTTRRNGPIEAGSKLDRWLTWAREHADRTDPLVGD